MVEVTTVSEQEALMLTVAADALSLLARLHDREPDRDLISLLLKRPVRNLFGSLLDSEEGKQALAVWHTALDELTGDLDETLLDNLSAEYADFYLTHNFRIAPTGSVWLTEDHLEKQEPMFEVRKWYENYGLKVDNWRMRSDDHIVYELEFLSFLCRQASEVSVSDAAFFMDDHILPWMPEFAQKQAERAKLSLYRATGLLTLTMLEELRCALEDLLGEPRRVRNMDNIGTNAAVCGAEQQVAAYMPGQSESW